MRLEVRRRGVEITEELRAHLGERLRRALGRLTRHIDRVRVYLRDTNGPRGGLGMRCRMVVELSARRRVVVAGTDTAVSGAIARTARRAGLAVKRHVGRRRAHRRPPRHPARAVGQVADRVHSAPDKDGERHRGKKHRHEEKQGDTAMNNRTIILSDADHQRLEAMIECARYDSNLRQDYLDALEGELKRAQVVPQADVPDAVITMNSVVCLRDLDTDEREDYKLVYPSDADVARGRISVLAPIGTAILGYRLGDVIEWAVPAGMRRLRVEEVRYQPERAGALHR